MLLLDDSSPGAIVVDTAVPPSRARVHEALIRAWPRLTGRIAFVASRVEDVPLTRDDVIVSIHACGALSDVVLERATSARARVAVLPCCHDLDVNDAANLTGWVDGPLAVDVVRALHLKQRGYRIWTQSISADITPKNRLLIGTPVNGLDRS
jgi:hypothetical protein